MPYFRPKENRRRSIKIMNESVSYIYLVWGDFSMRDQSTTINDEGFTHACVL